MKITDEAGHPLAVTDLNGAELRALRVLASAGMIPPLAPLAPQEPAAVGGQGVLVEQDFTRTPRKATAKPSRKPAATARPTTKAS